MNGIGSDGYNAMFVVHMIGVVAAFGPVLAYPALTRMGTEATSSLARRLHITLVVPGLVVAMVAGMGLIGFSDDVFEFSAAWVSASFAVVMVLLALAFPFVSALEATGKGDEKARGRVAMLSGITHLGLVVLLVLMIWKPGS